MRLVSKSAIFLFQDGKFKRNSRPREGAFAVFTRLFEYLDMKPDVPEKDLLPPPRSAARQHGGEAMLARGGLHARLYERQFRTVASLAQP